MRRHIYICCFTCENVKPFWVGINQWISEQTETLIHLNGIEIIMGCPREVPPIFHLFVTVAKMHIYSCKFFGCVLIVQGFTMEMNRINSIESALLPKIIP